MARAAVQRRLIWRRATLLENRAETARVHRLSFEVDGWPGHLPGQHLDLRLTADDGYTAQRSYSIASAPEETSVQLLVERFDGGEVSPYLTDEMRPDDVLELRGPIGGYFVWSAAADRDALGGERRRPVQLVAGGAGVSPFLAMLDHARRSEAATPVRLLYSARTADDVLGADLLDDAGSSASTTVTLTRGAPEGWTGPVGRIDAGMLTRYAFEPGARPRIFVCGPTTFVETTATTLVDLGHDPTSIRLERFGASPEPAG